ncbi:hypothetical protein K402DRAFT_379907 [Aulographum hederae CBS 113979]|uniref:NAD(P)-binding domain-containing protein n=1 Tax=Aulographum hederae CBS 113979 TaxID=1176131 RepID=A0A6G1GVT6_9PEZI|nr:hypothetical protein K402DRAFT_379907 [Aulographum hederae CBS 113979]
MSSPHILLIGGHGKIAQLMTPLLLARKWTVTSLIRASEQEPAIHKLGEGQPGTLKTLVSSLEEVRSVEDAKAVLGKVKPSWVVWSAGAGGRGGASRTNAIDRDTCIHFLRATHQDSSISKFLLVSYLGSRRNKPSWWSEDEWKASVEVNEGALAAYYKAKLASDEFLRSVTLSRGAGFSGIDLRPGRLIDDPVTKVQLGKTSGQGQVSRAAVAEVSVRLLESGYSGWCDMYDGDEEIGAAVERVTREKVDCFEEEDEGAVKGLVNE